MNPIQLTFNVNLDTEQVAGLLKALGIKPTDLQQPSPTDLEGRFVFLKFRGNHEMKNRPITDGKYLVIRQLSRSLEVIKPNLGWDASYANSVKTDPDDPHSYEVVDTYEDWVTVRFMAEEIENHAEIYCRNWGPDVLERLRRNGRRLKAILKNWASQ